eukprot:1605472-Rhodomonas_salina.1
MVMIWTTVLTRIQGQSALGYLSPHSLSASPRTLVARLSTPTQQTQLTTSLPTPHQHACCCPHTTLTHLLPLSHSSTGLRHGPGDPSVARLGGVEVLVQKPHVG